MATVTVLGASGAVSVPFSTQTGANLAQQLANQITAAIQRNVLAAAPANTIPPLPLTAGGPTQGEAVLGGNAPAPSAAAVLIPAIYPALVDNSSNAVLAVPADAAAATPFSILGGMSGLAFLAGATTVGGSLFVGGGANVISSYAGTDAPNAGNGGLVGNWVIGTDGGNAAADLVYLATGGDVILSGGNDTIHAGGASAAIIAEGSGARTIFLGSGNVAFDGGATRGDRIFGNDGATGSVSATLGGGGGGIAFASAANTTLVGGGDGDFLFGSAASAPQVKLYARGHNQTANVTMEGAGAQSTLVGGTGGDSLYGGAGSDMFFAGSGTNTIWAGLGNDSVVFSKDLTGGAQDVINNFNPATDTLFTLNYGAAPVVTSSGAAPLTIKLADNTQVTFTNLNASQFSLLKIVST